MTKPSTQLRLDFLEAAGMKTHFLSSSNLDFQDIQNNFESYIGSTEIPLGIVGPLLFNDAGQHELVYCAAGTLEGALVASMNRGAKALSQSGGFSATIAWQRMCRAPLFLFASENEAKAFATFIPLIFPEVKKVAEKYSNHASLLDIHVVAIDSEVHLKFMYATGDASGQNMTTTCTWHAMLFIADLLKKEKNITPLDFVIEGNGASDKKVSQHNISSGRGINVTAECFLPEKVIKEVLRTSSEALERCLLPSQKLAKRDGMVGYNINVANAIASIFVATGQDLASVHESGVGILHLERKKDGLFLQLNLPNLVIGTVGGGTHLPKQSQALELMGCKGSGKVERFAKMIAGFALGLEISTYAAIVSGEFAKAHEKLGRNKPVKWLLRSELTPDFILPALNDFFKDKEILHIKVVEDGLLENGIITNVTTRISKKLIGFVPLKVLYKEGNEERSLPLLLKSKPLDEEVIKGLHVIAASIDPALSDLFKLLKEHLEFKNSHLKEMALYTYLHEQRFEYMPTFYGQYSAEKREIYFFIQEFFDYSSLKIVNSENHPERWQKENILHTIAAITQFHQNVRIADFKEIQEFLPWKSAGLYKKLLSILLKEGSSQNNETHLQKLFSDIDHFEEEVKSIVLPITIVHNDFNSRNIAIRANGKALIYDWELAVIDFPHRDIVELLSFVLPENFTKEELFFYLDYHHGLYDCIRPSDWRRAYRYSLKTYISSRLSFYEVAGILIKYDFSGRVLNIAFRMLDLLEEDK